MGTELVYGIARVKDEADVIAHTVRRMLREVDFVLVSDNGSTDGTRDLLEDFVGRGVEVLDDPDPAYYQSRAMSELAEAAASRGAAWVVPFDADEAWYSPFGRIGDVLSEQPQAAIATATLIDHVATALDPPLADPVERIRWRRTAPAPLPKVACRAALPVTIAQGNHGASFPVETVDGLLIVRHFPYRSAEQFVSKVRNGAAAYAATDLPADQGAHWRQYGQLLDAGGPGAIGDVFRAWFWSADPEADPELMLDPCP